MKGLKDKVAVVTGGSSGIGEACVHRLVDEGAFVVTTGRDEERTRSVCESVSDPERAYPVLGDVRQAEDCERIIQSAIDLHGHVDILVNSAGVLVIKPFMETTEEDFRHCWDTNMMGATFMIKAAMRNMLPRKEGVVINITSVAGLRGRYDLTAYCASKAGLTLLTRCLAKEYGPDGIRFVSVAPAYIDGPMLDWELSQEPDPVAYMAEVSSRYPLGRIGRRDEVASIVSFLVSEEAEWVTGCSWILDGGNLA